MKGKPAVVLNIPSQNYLFIQEGGPYPKRHICGTGGTGIYLRWKEQKEEVYHIIIYLYYGISVSDIQPHVGPVRYRYLFDEKNSKK